MNEYSPDENHSMFFTFVNDYETFNSLMSCLAYAEKINKFAESVYSAKYSDRMSLKKLNIKDDISFINLL